MKEVVNLKGKKEMVPVSTPVRTNGGVHYLHTPEEEAEMAAREAAYLAEKADYEANHKYKDDRAAAHKSVGDQLDMIYQDQVNGTTIFRDYVAAIKLAYPKPGV